MQTLQQFAQSKDAVISNMQRLQQQTVQAGQTFQQFNQQLNQSSQHFNQLNQTNNTLNQTSNTLNQTFRQTNQTFQQTNQTLNQTNQTFNTTVNVMRQAAQAGQGASSAWQSIFQIAGGIGLATSLQAIVGQLVSFAQSIVQVGVQMQQLRASFTAITGDARSAQQAFAFIVQTSNDTGQSVQTLAQSYRILSAATRGTALEGQDTNRLFVALSNAARAYGLSTEQLGRVLVGFQQVISKGKVEQEELRQQIGEALPNALGIAARGFGVTTERLNEMISRGMDATTFVRAFTRQLESELPQGTQKVETAAQAFNRLGNEILLLKDAIAQSGLLKWLADTAGAVANVAEEWRKAYEQRQRYIALQAQQATGGRATAADQPRVEAGVAAIEQAREQLQFLEEMQRRGAGALGGIPIVRQIEEARRALAELQREQQALLPDVRLRARAQAGVEARLDIEGRGDDRLRQQQERERDIEAGQTRIRNILARQQEQLEQINRTPFLHELDRAEERLKVITETTKQLRDLLQTMPAAVQQGMTAPLTAGAGPLQAMVERLAVERGIDPRLAVALVQQESGFRPGAVSPAGALGLLQVMPGTAQGLQPGLTRQQILEPETNVRLGLDYLAQLLRQFSGDVQRALTAYNAGPGRGGIPLPTGENATFAQQVLARIPGGLGGGIQGVLADQERLAQAAKEAAEAQKPDPENLARIRATGQEQLRAIEAEIQLRQRAREQAESLAATLERAQQFIGAPQQSLAERAAAQVEAQGAQLRASLQRALVQIEQDPAVLNIAPRLVEQFQAALAALPEAVAAQARIASQRVEAEQRRTLQGLGDQLDQMAERLASATADPVAQAVARVRREFAGMTDQLDMLALKLRELEATTGGAQRETVRALLERIPQIRTRLEQTQPYQEEVAALKASLDAIKERAAAQMAATEAQDRFNASLEETIERLRTPRQQGFPFYTQSPQEEVAQAEARELSRTGRPLFSEDEEGAAARRRAVGLTDQRRRFEQLAYAAGLFEQFAGSVSQAWTTALTGIADGTRTVSEAFREMARSILQSLAQIAAQEGFRALIRLGVGAILGAGTGAAGVGGGGTLTESATGAGINPVLFQGGGQVHRPTFAMLGEGPAHTLPETILNRQQMESLLSRGGPGQAQSHVTVINVPSREAAEQTAAQQRALGRMTVINYVLSDLQQGEASSINRTLRTLQR